MDAREWKELEGYVEELQTILVEPVLTPSRFLSTTGAYYHLNNGKVIYREELLKDGGDGSAVIILPITDENDTLVKNATYPQNAYKLRFSN